MNAATSHTLRELSSKADSEAARTKQHETLKERMIAAGDDELLLLIAGDNQDAFRILVDRHVDRAYSTALRILTNPSDAEDVVQEALVQVWTKRALWQPGRAQFSTWLYRVVTNRCIDLLRRPKAEAIDILPEIADGQLDQVQEIARREASTLLNEALARLPDQQRIALVLSYSENLSNGEVAEIMETTVYAVESLLKRGRQKLRQILRNQGEAISPLLRND